MSQNQDIGTTDLKSQLTALNDEILRAEEAGQTAKLEPLLPTDFTIIRADGVKYGRKAFLDAVPANESVKKSGR